ncbi:MAG: dihydrofolate reductase family protein [Lentimicrobium sp.]|nr:dihydrofolate reductase family protein [Lentimicrobium sp.]
MRKLKLQVQMTVDGFIAGPNGEMDWMKFPWTEDITEYVREITNPVDTIILGKNLAQGFIPHWENVAKNPDDPDYEGGIKFSKTPKVVFTRTLDKSIWRNTVLATGDLEEEVNALKMQNGGDLIVYGGATFVNSLIRQGLIDDYHLFINPSAIGSGIPIFKEFDNRLNLTLIKSQSFNCGIVVLHYQPG